MPSTLYLLRHAKSSWDDPGLADEERPLAPRGERAARRMAQHIREAGIRPALVLCSPARRTRQTLEAVAGSFGKHVEVLVEDGLYGAGAWELTARLRRVPTELPSVMVVGRAGRDFTTCSTAVHLSLVVPLLRPAYGRCDRSKDQKDRSAGWSVWGAEKGRPS